MASFFPHTAVLPELFQNPRRAGATKVEVQLNEDETDIDEGRLTITDNGVGIANPKDLLGFGRSDWTDEKVRRERPAGMGIFSLARYPSVTIRSRALGERGWEVDLNPEVFRGHLSAEVRQLTDDMPVGTTISFTDKRITKDHVSCAARYYPLPVFLNGERINQSDWLEDAVHIEEFSGVRIGVKHTDRHRRLLKGRPLNFYGIQPTGFDPVCITTLDDLTWETMIDVQDCPHVELALPARREVIQNEFMEELKLACIRAIYRAMQQAKKPVDLSFSDYTRAHEMGFDLPEPRRLLTLWRPSEANYNRDLRPIDRTPLPGEPIRISKYISPSLQQTLYRAATAARAADRLTETSRDLSGYEWYDRIPRADTIAVIAVNGDTEKEIAPSERGEIIKADAIRLSLRSESSKEILNLPTDIATLGDDVWWGETPDIVISKDCEISIGELTDMLVASYFAPSDDIEADSFYTQQEECETHFSRLAMQMLVPPEEEMKMTIEDLVHRHFSFALQPDFSAEIKLHYGERPTITISKTESAA